MCELTGCMTAGQATLVITVERLTASLDRLIKRMK